MTQAEEFQGHYVIPGQVIMHTMGIPVPVGAGIKYQDLSPAPAQNNGRIQTSRAAAHDNAILNFHEMFWLLLQT
jgi:hypothetical protein